MLPRSDDCGWWSIHLHFTGWIYGPICDRVITGAIAPVVSSMRDEADIKGFFFVRYGQDGAHVRLRLLGSPAALQGKVPRLLEERGRVVGIPGGVRLRVRPYEPELQRYGGDLGIATAERCFDLSSTIAIALLQDMMPGGHRTRLARALLSSLALVHTFWPVREAAADFAAHYGTSYLSTVARDERTRATLKSAFDQGVERQAETLAPYVDDCWDRLQEGRSVTPVLDRWIDGLGTIKAELERHGRRLTIPPDRIVPSYLHMMNNRLGVTIAHEAYLATGIARILGGMRNTVS